MLWMHHSKSYGITRQPLNWVAQLIAIFRAWMGGQHTAMCHVDSKLFESIVVAGCSEVHITGHDCSVVVLSLHAGLITDPMALYRESKFTNIWTDEEKRVFKEK